MLGRRRDVARLQSDFYRDQFRKIINWLMGAIFIMFALIILIIYLILFQPVQKFYANTSEGKILPMPKAYHIALATTKS